MDVLEKKNIASVSNGFNSRVWRNRLAPANTSVRRNRASSHHSPDRNTVAPWGSGCRVLAQSDDSACSKGIWPRAKFPFFMISALPRFAICRSVPFAGVRRNVPVLRFLGLGGGTGAVRRGQCTDLGRVGGRGRREVPVASGPVNSYMGLYPFTRASSFSTTAGLPGDGIHDQLLQLLRPGGGHLPSPISFITFGWAVRHVLALDDQLLVHSRRGAAP